MLQLSTFPTPTKTDARSGRHPRSNPIDYMDDLRTMTAGVKGEADRLREKSERQIWRHQHNHSWSKQEVVRQFDRLAATVDAMRPVADKLRD